MGHPTCKAAVTHTQSDYQYFRLKVQKSIKIFSCSVQQTYKITHIILTMYFIHCIFTAELRQSVYLTVHRQTATEVRSLPSFAPHSLEPQQKHISVIKFPQRRTKHMQSAHTAGQAQFVEGTFVLTKERCSTAVVPVGIFGDGEQPSSVTGNYERLAERNSPTHRVQNYGRTVWAGFH